VPLHPLRGLADTAVPTFSLKGVPGISGLLGADAPRPSELGVLGKGMDGTASGRLQFCDKKGCISTFSLPDEDSFIPPWTYVPEETAAVSSFDARKAQLRAEALAEAIAAGAPPPPPRKSLEEAQEDLRKVLGSAGANIVTDQPRYVYAEFEDPQTGVKDDVEFLFSRDAPIVGYRSAPRSGDSDKRQRERIRDLRKALAPQGWKSVGRAVGVR